jgi:tetratricopeptide (TPR) repeat protein
MDLAKHFWRKLVTAPGGKANSPQDWITWGKYSETLAEHDAAIHCYTQAIRLDPGNFEHYVRRGFAHVGKGDLSSAYEDVDRAIQLAPDCAVAYSNRGTIRVMTGDVVGAIDDFSHAIRFAPTIALHYRNRAYAHTSKENVREAIGDFQKYLDLGGGIQNNDQKEIEDLLQDLRRQVKRRGFSVFRR